jgi:DNA-binding transcriptional regulator YiaG
MSTWTPDRIKALRTSLNMSQQAFGVMVGVTREYINKLESGVRTPGKTMCILLDCIENSRESDDNVKTKDRKKN